MCIKNLNVNFTFYENVVIEEGENNATTFYNPFDTIKTNNVNGVNVINEFFAVIDLNYIHENDEVDWINEKNILLVLTIKNTEESNAKTDILSLTIIDDKKVEEKKSFNLRKVVKISNKKFIELNSGEYLVELLIGCRNACSSSRGQVANGTDENDKLELKLQSQMMLKIV